MADIVLTAKQKEMWDSFLNNDYRWVVAVGGKGSAKTALITFLLAHLFFSEDFAGSRILIARESLRDLENTIISEFNRLRLKLNIPEDLIEQNAKLQKFLNTQNNTELYYLSLSDKGDQYRSVLSYEFNIVFIDEVDRISQEAFKEVSERLRFPHKFNKGFLSLNPVPEVHWVYKNFVENPIPNSIVIRSSSYDNYLIIKIPMKTLENLVEYKYKDKLYYVKDNIRYEVIGQQDGFYFVKRFHLPHSWYVELEYRPYAYKRVMLDGYWGSPNVGDGIYSSYFSENNILKNQISLYDIRYYGRLYIGLDFGVRHPAYILFYEDEWGRITAVDELLGDDISSIDFVGIIRKRLREKFKIDIQEVVIYGDVAGSYREQGDGLSIIHKIQQQYGITIHSQKIGVGDSIFTVREKLVNQIQNQPALKVSQECVLTLSGMLGEFKFDKNGRPIKDNYYEHIHDAFRYGLNGVLSKQKTNKLTIIKPNY
jgi:hypothetical protein